jgi:carboxyl-terminal processing protease
MTQRPRPIRHSVLILAALVGLLWMTPWLSAEPTPGKDDQTVARLVCAFLHQGHLNRPELGEELSRHLARRFLKDLDPGKLYFLQSDVDEFKKDEDKLTAQLQEGDLSFAYKVYQRLLERMNERQKLIEELIKAPQDYTIKESLQTDFDAIPYAENQEQLRERWRKRIKFDLLLHRLGTKPLSDGEAQKKVLARYHSVLKRWKQVDNYELMELYLSDLTTSVDPHSTYMSPSTVDDFNVAMRLHLEGIGALLRSENGETIIAEIVPGGAAAKDGRLKPNDKIIAVAQGDDKFTDVTDLKLRDVVKLIRGARGTQVQLRVIPTGKLEPVVYELTRQKIELKAQAARGEVIEQGKKPNGQPYRIGVIDLPSFYADMGREGVGEGAVKSATEDVRRILKGFEDQGVDGVVLDLRRNGGGSLNEALALTGLFIDRGPVVQVKGSRGRVQTKDDPEPGTVYAGPLMVLISRFSASASEILAGALQDYGRALIVGDSTTHGKGTVQVLVDLGSQLPDADPPPKLGDLKLTIQQFYRVNGDSTQNRGVAADVVVPALSDALSDGEKELDHALAFDKVKPVEHEEMHLVSPDLKAALRSRSSERVKNSKDFAKLIKEIDQVKKRRTSKLLPLNEKELREQYNNKDDAEKAERGLEDGMPTETPANAAYKFPRNFVTNEYLQIMQDFLQGKQLLGAR